MRGSWIALACLAGLVGSVTACQPLYGGKPEKLHNPERKKKPPEPPEAAVQVKYNEECTVSMNGDPKLVKRQTSVSNTLVDEGDNAIAQYNKARTATPPQSEAAGNFAKEAIDKYRNALVKDPYNIGATLKLAEAYDIVLRKGCALALLKRIAAFSNHPQFSKEGNRDADEVNDNPSLFKGYRKDAVAAVGR